MSRYKARKPRRPRGVGPGPYYGAPHEHLDCGCAVRVIEPVAEPRCPACGRLSAMFAAGVTVPTQAPVGSLKAFYVGCSCGHEWEQQCLIVA